ncbi:MAG: NAD(P)H-hydrate dehydratase, partial [Candidatus Hodarchaeota archaeon]
MMSDTISTLEMSIIDVNSEFLGVNRQVLMENAGRGLADLIWDVYQKKNRSNLFIFAGKGGNGGDGMVAARHLARYIPISLYLLGSNKDISKRSTSVNWEILRNMTDSIKLSEIKQVNEVEQLEIDSTSLIVDTLLGTGIRGSIREPLASLLNLINKSQEKGAIVISADTPTGIDPNTGKKSNIFLKPDYTGIFHKQKQGLSSKNSGKIKILPIGIPPEAEKIIGPGDLLSLKKHQKWSKKGDRGKVLVIGGNETYSGAPALAAMGAIQAGADLVTILAPRRISSAIRSYSPELIVKDYATSHLTVESVSSELIKQNDVILLGPGLGQHEDTQKSVLKILDLIKGFDKPLILDADALKLIDLKKVTENTILTPHAGEFSVLTDVIIPSGSDRFQERVDLVQEVSLNFPNIWVVKGHWDIVADNSCLKINKTGISQMTRGGTGDILAGLISGFVKSSKSLFYAACIGTFINGKAGELAKEAFSLSRLLKKVPIAIQMSLKFIRDD